MPTDPLDDRIRSLVADAVSSAPAAPSLSLRTPVAASPSRRGLVWAGIGIAACLAAVAALVWTSGDDDRSIVAGSTSSAPDTTEVISPWPDGVAVIVASSRGIERVSSEDGRAVVTRVLDGVAVARAFELQDGSIVYQESGGSIRYIWRDSEVRPTELVTGDGSGSTILEDADAPNGVLQLVYRTPTTDPAAAGDLAVWRQPLEPLSFLLPGGFGVGYRRFTIVDDYSVVAATIDDTGQRGSYKSTYRNGVPETAVDTYDDPVALAADGAGSVAWLSADGRVSTTGVRDGVIAILEDPSSVVDMDYRTEWLAVNRADDSMMLVATATGTNYAVPVADGVVTVSRSAAPSTLPTATTILEAPTTVGPTPSTVLPTSWPPMVTAGPDGVWEYGPDGTLQWTDEPMTFAVKAPDGSMLMQRPGDGDLSTAQSQAASLPLRQRAPGAPLEDLFGALFPAADVVPGWYRLHDAALVDGRPLVILERQAEQVNIESPRGALLVLDLEARTLEQVGEVGGWESGISRLHLAETGLIVGEDRAEGFSGLFSQRIDGTPPLTAADLGLEADFVDCGSTECRRLFTISRDGSTVAWLEGTTLVRRALDTLAAFPAVDLGESALDATELSISADVAVYDRIFIDAAPVVVYLDGDTARSVQLTPAARTALS
jgi:hypothetical protein